MATPPPYACLADALFHVDQACASLAKDSAGGLQAQLEAVAQVRTVLVRELHTTLSTAGAARAPVIAPVPPSAATQLLLPPVGPSLGAKPPGPRARGDVQVTPAKASEPKLGALVERCCLSVSEPCDGGARSSPSRQGGASGGGAIDCEWQLFQRVPGAAQGREGAWLVALRTSGSLAFAC